VLHSVRARLTLWYTAVVAVVLIAFSIISYVVLARAIRAATDASLADTAREFAATVAAGRSNAVSGSDVHLDFRYSDRALAILDTAGTVIASSHTVLAPGEQRQMARAVRSGARGFTTLEGGPESDGLRLFLLPVEVLGQRYVIAAAQSLDEQADRLESAQRAVALGIPLALLLAAGGGYLLARKALAPVAAMSLKARQIGAETLAERIPAANERDELGLLAVTLNELLERLQRSFDSQRRFMAEASHELRTPVAIIQGEADVTLSRPDRTAAEYRESMEIIRKSALKLTRIVENLFLLARTDAGAYPIRKARFYLDELIADCVRSLRNIAAMHDVTLEQSSDPDLVVVADEELLSRMLLNLIDNALKFTPAGGKVSICTTAAGDVYSIRVSDTGGGIPAGDRARIFDRFFRVARPKHAPTGAGLGLPIARWIAEAHGGSLVLERSDASGSTFHVTLRAG
jgi:two-component system OmpR family sensor kinase